jgi:anti-anti-sigma regulatory factor
VVDLTAIDLIDSAGLGALVSLRNRLRHDGHRLGVAFSRSASIFRTAGLSSAFVGAADSDTVLSRLRPTGHDPPLRPEV